MEDVEFGPTATVRIHEKDKRSASSHSEEHSAAADGLASSDPTKIGSPLFPSRRGERLTRVGVCARAWMLLLDMFHRQPGASSRRRPQPTSTARIARSRFPGSSPDPERRAMFRPVR